MKSFFDFYTMLSEQLPVPAPPPGAATQPPKTPQAPQGPSATQPVQPNKTPDSRQVSGPAGDPATANIINSLKKYTPKVQDEKTKKSLEDIAKALTNPIPTGTSPKVSGNATNPQTQGQTPQG